MSEELIWVSGGEGYGFQRRSIGEVFFYKDKYLKVVKNKSSYYRDDGMSFGVGDESGWNYCYGCVEATEEETAPVREKREKALKSRELKKRLDDICRMIRTEGVFPDKQEFPKGIVYPYDMRTYGYGGGHWIAIQPDKIWAIGGNSGDGDCWDHSNLPCCIGYYVPFDDKIAKEIAEIMEFFKIKKEER